MKTLNFPFKLVFLFLLFSLTTQHLALNTLLAQAPQKFSYQAVARDGGTLLIDKSINVQFEVLQGSQSGDVVWQETQAATTNAEGLFSLKVGEVNALALDWSDGPFYLKVKVDLYDGSGLRDFGISELLSVPFALNAATVSSLQNLEIIEPDSYHPDSALFKVVNNDGNVVFAVYNEGVRIYVADMPEKKGSRGGFAIGGFNVGKGITNEYMRVTPDSVRVYVDETISKGSRGGFAIGGFNAGKATVTDFLHLTPDNYFIGHQAGSSITTGLYNSFFGYDAGISNTVGNSNVFIGNETGYGNVSGNWNIFVGNSVGYANTTGSANIFMGDEAGISNTTGSGNVFMGDWAGYTNDIGAFNVFIGADAGLANSDGQENVFIGTSAGEDNQDGDYNVFLGTLSGNSNTSGLGNVFLGQEAGMSNMGGSLNIAIGALSGNSNTAGSNNVFLGFSAGLNETGSNKLYIDNSGASWDQALIYGEFDFDYLSFYADMDVAGTVYALDVVLPSDLKWKKNISGYEAALPKILDLNPVSFDWRVEEFPNKKFPNGNQIGLIAQELEKVFPELVQETRKGDKAVNYSKLTVVLLEAIQEQQLMIEELNRRIEELEQK